MDRGWYFRFSMILTALVVGWLALWPSLDPWLPAPPLVKRWFRGRISPGLDIKGGLRLMYEVEVDAAIRDRRDRLADALVERLGAKLKLYKGDEPPTREELAKIGERLRVEKLGEQRIRVTFKRPADAKVATRDFLKQEFGDLRPLNRSTEGQIEFVMREEQLQELRKTAIDQTVRTISNRIDELQVRETTVIGRDSDVIVEIPGADEAMFDRIRSIISRTARLEFKVVDDEGSTPFVQSLGELPQGVEKDSEVASAGADKPSVPSAFLVARGAEGRRRLQELIASAKVPEDHQLALGKVDEAPSETKKKGGQEAWRTYYLFRNTEVTGEDVKDAFVSYDTTEGNRPYVAINFNATGGGRFERFTGRNVKRRMAIVLDDRVESAPVVQQKIGGGRARITLGSMTDFNNLMREANDLSIVLRAGALPAPIRKSNEQLIGPTLGRDSIRRGAEGALIGIGLVLLFMLFYYQVAGMVADVMVVLNVLLLLAVLSGFEATLTLPGLAGIALTVGMAVDANVLITERIREELRLGKSPRSAVDQGFARAFWSIFDSQLTTFIAGVVLFQFGSGPIKGFAVTLMIGIVTSLFTGVFCSKVMLDWIVRGLRVKRLRVG